MSIIADPECFFPSFGAFLEGLMIGSDGLTDSSAEVDGACSSSFEIDAIFSSTATGAVIALIAVFLFHPNRRGGQWKSEKNKKLF